MTIRVAVNGFGRIGRNIVRALYESPAYREAVTLVAINDLADIRSMAHLLKYDTVHGRFGSEVSVSDEAITIDGRSIQYLSSRDPRELPWGDLGVDVVLECTGFFATRDKAMAHIEAGAKKVLISAPAGQDVDRTVVFGVNHEELTASDVIVSNASCTTNCLAPVAQVLDENAGFEQGTMVTIHAYTSDQRLTDNIHSDWRRARAAGHSMIPTKTGAAAAVGLVLPTLAGLLDGYAVRVPTINVSMVDLTFTTKKDVSVDEINGWMKGASSGRLAGVLGYNEEPLVSIDFVHHPASSIFDATQTRKVGSLYKVVSWYDNEWGFSNRMLDTASAMMAAGALGE